MDGVQFVSSAAVARNEAWDNAGIKDDGNDADIAGPSDAQKIVEGAAMVSRPGPSAQHSDGPRGQKARQGRSPVISPRFGRPSSTDTSLESDQGERSTQAIRGRKNAKRQIRATKKYYETMESRIDRLETALLKVEPRIETVLPEDDTASVEGVRIVRRKSPEPRTILTVQDELSRTEPELKWITWPEWLATAHRPGVPGKISAIDALSGPPSRYSDPKTTAADFECVASPESATQAELKLPKAWRDGSTVTSKTAWTHQDFPPRRPKTYWTLKDFPDRVRINSIALIRTLEDIHGEDLVLNDDPLVLLRPFKLLFHLEKEIRVKLQGLEAKWDQPAESDPSSKNDTLKGVTGDKESITENKKAKHEVLSDSDWESTINQGRLGLYKDSKNTMDDLRVLVAFIDCLKPAVDVLALSHGLTSGVITFADLWYLFKPGDDIYIPKSRQKTWRILHVAGGRSFLSPDKTHGKWIRRRARDRNYSPVTTDEESDEYEERRQRAQTGSAFVIDCFFITFDGKKFGPAQSRFQISRFDGEKQIRHLDMYPVRFDARVTRESLIREGSRFLDIIETGHYYFLGRSVDPYMDTANDIPNRVHISAEQTRLPRSQRVRLEDIDSEVMIDFDKTFQEKPDWIPLIGLEAVFKQDKRETLEVVREVNDKSDFIEMVDRTIDEDGWWDQRSTDQLLDTDHILQAEFQGRSVEKWDLEQRRDDMILLSTRAFGFVLRTRTWVVACFPTDQDSLRVIAPRLSSYHDLHLREGQKEMVYGLVKSHFKHKEKSRTRIDTFNEEITQEHRTAKEVVEDRVHNDSNYDIISGKGKGLIILLHGAPGVGKTSTAECIAEAHGKPLFPITCGDLGTTAESVEFVLSTNFSLAQSWDCIMLLDEADVFLAQRSKTDLERNALVSVFLRVLEYYTAFKSRIHMSLHYKQLNLPQTLKIWQTNLNKTKERAENVIEVRESDIMEYAMNFWAENERLGRSHWNGRQIRNAFNTAAALAEHAAEIDGEESVVSKPVLQPRHFETVAEAIMVFDEYLKSVQGFGDAELSWWNQNRNDNFQRDQTARAPPQPSYSAAPPSNVGTNMYRPPSSTAYHTPAKNPPVNDVHYMQNFTHRVNAPSDPYAAGPGANRYSAHQYQQSDPNFLSPAQQQRPPGNAPPFPSFPSDQTGVSFSTPSPSGPQMMSGGSTSTYNEQGGSWDVQQQYHMRSQSQHGQDQQLPHMGQSLAGGVLDQSRDRGMPISSMMGEMQNPSGARNSGGGTGRERGWEEGGSY